MHKTKAVAASMTLALALGGCAASLTPEQLVAKTVPDRSVPIFFTWFSPTFPNSVGGVGVYQQFINPGRDEIKYVRVQYSAQNRVLDNVASSIANMKYGGTEMVGPFPFGYVSQTAKFDVLWYNASIKCVTMEVVSVTYMNGRELNITGKEVEKLVPNGQRRSCDK